MFGYSKGQALEHIMNALPTRYCYLFFGNQSLTETPESANHVMTKEKLKKKEIAGQSTTPYISLKTHLSEKHKPVKFDEYSLLNNQIDRLAEVIDRLNTRLKGKKNQQNRPYNPFIHRDRGHRHYPSYDRGMIEGKAISDGGLMIEIEEDTLYSEANPEVITIQEGHTEDKINIEIE